MHVMEVLLKMKLTDFCILFAVLMIGLFAVNDLKIKLINETQKSQIMLNNNMDEIVVDGLNAGFVGVSDSGAKKVDLDVVSRQVFEEMSVLFYGKTNMKNMVEKWVKSFIYVSEDGYYIYENGKWSEKNVFEYEMSHSDRVEIISEIIEKATGEIPLISYNDGESYKNTIDDNTLIIVYCGYNFYSNEFVYKNTYMSAACIKEKK